MNVQARPCLTVVVPCYNEETTVLTVLKQVLASPWVSEVVVVDDGSTDGTESSWPVSTTPECG